MGNMPKQINFQLTADQLAELGEVSKHDKRPEVRQRATAIRLLSLGEKPAQVAAVMAVSTVSIYKWWHHYQVDGIEGLANRPKGRPETKAAVAYLQALEQALASEPSHFGYHFAIWTVKRLRDHLLRLTGVQLSVAYLSEVMQREGYVYRRPKHDLSNRQDAAAKVEAQAQLQELKKVPPLLGSSLWTKRR
jgi:transposase